MIPVRILISTQCLHNFFKDNFYFVSKISKAQTNTYCPSTFKTKYELCYLCNKVNYFSNHYELWKKFSTSLCSHYSLHIWRRLQYRSVIPISFRLPCRRIWSPLKICLGPSLTWTLQRERGPTQSQQTVRWGPENVSD